MGQYYKAIFLNEKKNRPVNFVESYDFGSGAKLMEHSWLKNSFVRFVELQLIAQPRNLVWAGDYADCEKDLTIDEIKHFVDETNKYWTLETLKKEGLNLYHLRDRVGKITHDEEFKKDENKYKHDFKCVAPSKYKYLINYDKKQFVDKTKTPKSADGWQIHALPLLTCEGNGRGGGDYHKGGDLVGVWSRDKIGIGCKKSDIPKGFKEIIVDFLE